MQYFEGFVLPVQTAGKQAYLDMVHRTAPIFAEYGAARTVECWADDVPDGKITDLKRAVQLTEEETIVFSWILWPDKATHDAAHPKMWADDRMRSNAPRPFDGRRMMVGGFETLFDTGNAGTFGYADGMIASVPNDRRQAHLDHTSFATRLFRENGASRLVDGWGVYVPDGKTTDFKRAVQSKQDETVVFSWIEWPDKPTRDAGMATLMQDPRMRTMPPAWNAQLMIFGGFTPIFDTDFPG